METRQCPVCGAEFKPKAKHQEYCNVNCRRRRQYKRGKERGVAYLQYKPKSKPKPKPAPAQNVARCEFCKVDFVQKFPSQKYCSGKCRKNRENERVREKAQKQKQLEALGIMKYTNTCVICGAQFNTNNKKRKACSTECIRAYRRKNPHPNIARGETRREKKSRENREKWAAITAKCNELGLSYGEAVAKGLID